VLEAVVEVDGIQLNTVVVAAHFAATTLVVAVPRNGSSTLSPTKLNLRISRSARPTG